MAPDTFSDYLALHEYAESRGLEYAWEGTNTFEQRKGTLTPDQYELIAVHTRKGVKMALLFPKGRLSGR